MLSFTPYRYIETIEQKESWDIKHLPPTGRVAIITYQVFQCKFYQRPDRSSVLTLASLTVTIYLYMHLPGYTRDFEVHIYGL